MFALADSKNFFASSQTTTAARYAEDQCLGIKMGAPLFKHERYFRDNGVHVFCSSYALYENMFARMMAILVEMGFVE